MLISTLSSSVIHHSFTFSEHFLLPFSYFYTQSLWHSVLSSSVWVQVMFERGSTRKPKREKRNLTQQFIAALRPFSALCYYFLECQLNYTHQTDNTLRIHQFWDLFGKKKNLAPADVMRLAAPPGQRVYGRERARRRQSWQQEGEGSHKVATQSRRLACLSRVNIGPRLHTVMTNTGGRAQKHYQD